MNDVNDIDDDNIDFGDSDFLASHDRSVGDFRQSDHENKHKIIEKMLALRHNMKYNKHLLSVYMKAKGLFDTMVEEHRSQLYYLDEIYRHINQLIRENLSTTSKQTNGMMSELRKDKKRIGVLLKRMRASYEKLMNVDTVVGVTIDKMNEITFMADAEMAENNKAAEDADEDLEEDDEDLEEEADEALEEDDEDLEEEADEDLEEEADEDLDEDEDDLDEDEDEDDLDEDEADEDEDEDDLDEDEDDLDEDEADLDEDEDDLDEDEDDLDEDDLDEDEADEDEEEEADNDEADEGKVILLY